MGRLGIGSLVVLGALACSKGEKFPDPISVPRPTLDFTVPLILQDFGRKVCADLREIIPEDRLSRGQSVGVIDRLTGKKAEVWVTCYDHGGGAIARADETTGFPSGLESQNFDFPKAIELDSSEKISTYLDEKSVVFFGENHLPELSRDSHRFISLMPLFKQKGFDIGMEIDRDYQSVIDEYIHAPSPEAKDKLIRKLSWYPTKLDLVNIIEAAAKHGLLVYCIDNNTPGYTGDTAGCFGPRDEYMSDLLHKKIQMGSKIAVFTGASHATQGKFYETTVSFAEMQGECEDPDNPGPQVVIQRISAAKLLISQLGIDAVGSVDLNFCTDPYIPACIPESK